MSSILKWDTDNDELLLLVAYSMSKSRDSLVKMSVDVRVVKRRRTVDPTKHSELLKKTKLRSRNPTNQEPKTIPILNDELPLRGPIPLTRRERAASQPQQQWRQQIRNRYTTPVLRRVEGEFEHMFSHVNVKDVAQPAPPPVVTQTRNHLVLPGQYGGCTQKVSNRHTCDICKHNTFFLWKINK